MISDGSFTSEFVDEVLTEEFKKPTIEDMLRRHKLLTLGGRDLAPIFVDMDMDDIVDLGEAQSDEDPEETEDQKWTWKGFEKKINVPAGGPRNKNWKAFKLDCQIEAEKWSGVTEGVNIKLISNEVFMKLKGEVPQSLVSSFDRGNGGGGPVQPRPVPQQSNSIPDQVLNVRLDNVMRTVATPLAVRVFRENWLRKPHFPGGQSMNDIFKCHTCGCSGDFDILKICCFQQVLVYSTGQYQVITDTLKYFDQNVCGEGLLCKLDIGNLCRICEATFGPYSPLEVDGHENEVASLRKVGRNKLAHILTMSSHQYEFAFAEVSENCRKLGRKLHALGGFNSDDPLWCSRELRMHFGAIKSKEDIAARIAKANESWTVLEVEMEVESHARQRAEVGLFSEITQTQKYATFRQMRAETLKDVFLDEKISKVLVVPPVLDSAMSELQHEFSFLTKVKWRVICDYAHESDRFFTKEEIKKEKSCRADDYLFGSSLNSSYFNEGEVCVFMLGVQSPERPAGVQ